MPRLLAIEIENFQSITDTVRIELAPITLLFGPNSAGKSAVFDALELIRDVWSRDQHKQQAIGERLARWRHQRTASSPDLVTARTTLAIEFELESTLPWRCSMPDGHSDRITTIFADPTYQDDESQHWDTLRNLPNTARLSITFDGDAVWNLVLDLGGNRVMSFDHPSERIDEVGFPIVSLHTSHPIFFRTLNDSRDEFELIFRESTAYTDYTSRDGRGDLSFSGWLDGKELGDIAWTVADHVTPRSLTFVPVVPDRVRDAMLRVADGTLSHFTHQLLLILNSASALVPADRTVLPAPQTTIYVESDPLMPGEYVVPRAMRPLGSGMPPHFRDLAYAGYAKANARLMSEFGLGKL